MRTKFILHGGYTSERNNLNQSYFTEMVNDISDEGNILLVYFALKDEDVEEKYQDDSERLHTVAPGKRVKTVKASRKGFVDEVRDADVIYIRGGDTRKLRTALDAYPDFREAIRGKTVSGSSAGAYVLAKYYFSNSLNKIMEGYGCVPVRLVCHYESGIHPIPENVDPVSVMDEYDNDAELIALKDHEWVIREIET